jgi:hypothetical protein
MLVPARLAVGLEPLSVPDFFQSLAPIRLANFGSPADRAPARSFGRQRTIPFDRLPLQQCQAKRGATINFNTFLMRTRSVSLNAFFTQNSLKLITTPRLRHAWLRHDGPHLHRNRGGLLRCQRAIRGLVRKTLKALWKTSSLD